MKKTRLPGLTLIELLISMVILLPFLGVLIWLTSEISSSQLDTVNFDTSARETQFAAHVIAKDLDDATAIIQPANDTPANQLVLTTPDGAISYSVNDGRLVRTDGMGPEFLQSTRSTLEEFTASRTGPSLELVTVTLRARGSLLVVGTGDTPIIERIISRNIQ